MFSLCAQKKLCAWKMLYSVADVAQMGSGASVDRSVNRSGSGVGESWELIETQSRTRAHGIGHGELTGTCVALKRSALFLTRHASMPHFLEMSNLCAGGQLLQKKLHCPQGLCGILITKRGFGMYERQPLATTSLDQ